MKSFRNMSFISRSLITSTCIYVRTSSRKPQGYSAVLQDTITKVILAFFMGDDNSLFLVGEIKLNVTTNTKNNFKDQSTCRLYGARTETNIITRHMASSSSMTVSSSFSIQQPAAHAKGREMSQTSFLQLSL